MKPGNRTDVTVLIPAEKFWKMRVVAPGRFIFLLLGKIF
jgi:hypothetical protein